MPPRPSIVIATQSVERNLPALRLIRICAEFGDVTVITPHSGPDSADGIPIRRLVPRREKLYRGLAAAMRRLSKFAPRRWRNLIADGGLAHICGIKHHGANFRNVWRKEKLRPDLLIFDGGEYMTTGGKLARKAGAGTVYYVHEMFPNQDEHYTRLLTAFLVRHERRECLAASHIIVQHRLWGTLLRRRYRINPAKFTEITPSPETQVQQPGSSPGTPLRLYYHGLFHGNRALDVHIKAVALVDGVALDMRGSGDYEEELKRIARESGAEERIRFLPPIPTSELATSACSYDLGIVTGTNAHLNGRMSAGIKLYENMAAGIGLFGYRAVTLKNIIRRLGIGFTYDCSSPEKLAEALRYCVTHREQVAQARVNAARAAAETYNSETQFDRLRKLISAALRQAQAKS